MAGFFLRYSWDSPIGLKNIFTITNFKYQYYVDPINGKVLPTGQEVSPVVARIVDVCSDI